MKRMIVDVSSILWAGVFSGKDNEHGREIEADGKKVWVNGWEFAYENATQYITSMMTYIGIVPNQVIFVVEGKGSKARRIALYREYKAGPDSRTPEAYVEFNKAKEALTKAFRDVGSQTVTQDGVETDDVISYLVQELSGERVILTNDGDMAALIGPEVSLIRKGALVTENPYGPFPAQFITVYKALVGDSSDNIKGAPGFGPKAFLDLLVWAGDAGLAGLEGVIQRKEIAEVLTEDIAEFKPMKKIVDGAESVYTSYAVAKLHPEWCDTKQQPIVRIEDEVKGKVTDHRLLKWADADTSCAWWDELHPDKHHAIFDIELIGKERPVFLFCYHVVETGERGSFWWHKDGDMAKLEAVLKRKDLTWVSFNGNHFDAPITSAALCGKDPIVLKMIAAAIIEEGGKSWEMASRFGFDTVSFDHIDLWEVAPGVHISLKTYAGRMGYRTMVDMPFHHDQDIGEADLPVLESYCYNDLGVTAALFAQLATEVELRKEMSKEHGIDLRSKSDAQVAEAVLKKAAKISTRSEDTPKFVTYKAPSFIKTDSDDINDLIEQVERCEFKINPANGQVQAPDFLDEPLAIMSGTYQVGVGGLHSTHDKGLYAAATDNLLISDFDVASYYPNIMLKAGLTPRISGGDRFIEEYKKIYDRRIEAKRSGDKKVANALKISLNGTFGKLGSPYSAFYSPDLMLAVTLTGQLNLLCLIYEFECKPSIKVLSANTDGITVAYRPQDRDTILRAVSRNAERTGFEYEETRYAKIAMKDVNNYIAITSNDVPVIVSGDGAITNGKPDSGKAKRKGLYASKGLMKNPTMQVCSNMAVDYLKDGTMPAEAIAKYKDITDYVSIRNVKGGGIQYDSMIMVDDWVMVKDCTLADDWVEVEGGWYSPITDKTRKAKKRPTSVEVGDRAWARQAWLDAGLNRVVVRKSKPDPVEVGVGGDAFGRVARWYMQKDGALPINYIASGNKVPKTEGAKLCMTLPDALPDDVDFDWYIDETLNILDDLGVKLKDVGVKQEEKETA